jgi:hypothetical protein
MTSNDKNLEKIDIYFLKSLLGIVKDNKEELEWILQKQNQLRIEYLTFFKKDLKEIYTNISSLGESTNNDKKVDINSIIQTVIEVFKNDMDKSFSIVDSKFHSSIQEEVINRTTNILSSEINKGIYGGWNEGTEEEEGQDEEE